MNSSETISTQIPIPVSLYNEIAQRAQTQGHSLTHEIVSLLTDALQMNELCAEIAAWEAASDQDWLNLEGSLMREAP
jgi:hypothetical protein